MTANWDIKTARACMMPEVMPDFCKSCRDIRFCNSQKLNLRQMTIEEIQKGATHEQRRDI